MEPTREYLQQFIDNPPPVAGSSLTSNPDAPKAYERPPKFVSIHEASEHILTNLLEEENYLEMMDQLQEGRTVMEITQVMLFAGFSKGLWNPDLQLLLIEPVAYMLLALAEKAGIEDIKIYDGEEEDELAEKAQFNPNATAHQFNSLKRKSKPLTSIPSVKLTPEIKEKIEDLPEIQEKGLLERDE